MKRLQPVIWTKGTFLSPQHLQLQDRFLENLLQFHLESLSFRPWGFRTLQISQRGACRPVTARDLTSASGIFPDGLLFDIPDSGHRAAPETVADCFEPTRLPLDLYLAVPQYPRARLERGNSSRQGGARYRAEIELFRDENTGLSEKPVQIARKNLRLLAEGESLEGYSTLRVARVQRTPAGPFRPIPASCRRCSISSQRLSRRHRAPAGRDPHCALRRHLRSAPPEEPEPGRILPLPTSPISGCSTP